MQTVLMAEEPPVNLHEQDDDRLIRQIAAGDRSALAALYQRHGQVVLAQIMLLTGERALSEEILQDTMLAVWHGAGSFRGESRVRSWVIAISRRQARDRMRRRKVDTVTDDAFLSEWPAAGPGPEQQVLERAEAAAVADAIGELGSGHREVLGLVFGAGLTLAEAAGVLEVPLGTVKSRLAAARVALARSMSEKGYSR
jgi:RNA polymerase sigma-70 factor (ECF subfamily)